MAFIKVIVERVSRDLFKLANFMFALFVEFVFLFQFQFLFRFGLFCFLGFVSSAVLRSV